jgi:hypothetical protein
MRWIPAAAHGTWSAATCAAQSTSSSAIDGRGIGPRWVIRFRGLKFPIYLFSSETAPHGATPLHLAPTPHPTPRGGSTTPRRMLGTPIYGLGPTNGRIGP